MLRLKGTYSTSPIAIYNQVGIASPQICGPETPAQFVQEFSLPMMERTAMLPHLCFNMYGKIRSSILTIIFSKYTFSPLCVGNITQASRGLIWGKVSKSFLLLEHFRCCVLLPFFFTLPVRLFSTLDSLQLIGP